MAEFGGGSSAGYCPSVTEVLPAYLSSDFTQVGIGRFRIGVLEHHRLALHHDGLQLRELLVPVHDDRALGLRLRFTTF